jgi:hypothetical protein
MNGLASREAPDENTGVLIEVIVELEAVLEGP